MPRKPKVADLAPRRKTKGLGSLPFADTYRWILLSHLVEVPDFEDRESDGVQKGQLAAVMIIEWSIERIPAVDDLRHVTYRVQERT